MMRIEEARATWTPPWTDMHARIEVALDDEDLFDPEAAESSSPAA